jgi:hypothetical protein
LAEVLVPLLQDAHNDNGAKLRIDMLNAKAENAERRSSPGRRGTPFHVEVKVWD